MTDQEKQLLEMWFEACREYFGVYKASSARPGAQDNRWPNLSKWWVLEEEPGWKLDNLLNNLKFVTGLKAENWEEMERAYRKMTQK